MLPQLIKSKIAVPLGTLAFAAMFTYAATTALASESVISQATYVPGPDSNSATILIHGRFAAGNIPVVKLGDISTATTSGAPPSPDLVVASFSTTDIVVTVSHPIDSGVLPATYRLAVRTFDAAEREWNSAAIDLSIAASDVGFVVFSGPVEAIVVDGLTVGGKRVALTSQTKFSGAGSPARVADLHVGDRVAVTAQLVADNPPFASAIVRLP